MSSNTVLKASDLNKSFSGIVAAKDINVTINQGEIVGIIGAIIAFSLLVAIGD